MHQKGWLVAYWYLSELTYHQTVPAYLEAVLVQDPEIIDVAVTS